MMTLLFTLGNKQPIVEAVSKIRTMGSAMTTPETIVMSVGGSLIVPDEIDTDFLQSLKLLIEQETAASRRFIIITGGGKTSRRYVAAASTFLHVTNQQKDEIGIAACQMNAALLRPIFSELDVQINPDLDLYQPGASSDRAATRTAIRHGAKKVINLSNITHVYTADPKVDSEAKKIEDITWEDFRQIIPSEFTPNLSSPFDPEAAREAQEHNLEVATIYGYELDNLTRYLNNEPFVGTLIHP